MRITGWPFQVSTMILGIILLVITFSAGYLFLHPPVWFPVAITSAAVAYDRQFIWTLWITGFLFVAAQLMLAWIVLRRRKKDAGRRPTLHASWMAAVAMIAVEVALAAHGTSPLTATPAKNPETIEVYAHQFAWNFRYPGPDGVFGRVTTEFISDAGGNPVGIDPSDPRGKDDIVAATLRIPAGRDVLLLLHSRDVIHDFFVRELRTKQDIVPGMEIPLDIHADRPGQYEIACAELCGLGHSQMRSILIVMPPRNTTDGNASTDRAAVALALASADASSAPIIASSRASISSSRSSPSSCGSCLSLLMRFHLVYPQAQVLVRETLAHRAEGGVMTPELYLSLLTLHGTIMVFFVLTLAPLNAFGNLVLPEQLGAPRHGFPAPQYAVVLDRASRPSCSLIASFRRDRRRPAFRLDRLPAAERRRRHRRARRRPRPDALVLQHRPLLPSLRCSPPSTSSPP